MNKRSGLTLFQLLGAVLLVLGVFVYQYFGQGFSDTSPNPPAPPTVSALQNAKPYLPPTPTPPAADQPPTPTPSAVDQPGQPPVSIPEAPQTGQQANFDFYVLSLSWSPDYCAANSNDTQQCSLGKKLGFVLHGFWPQYTRGYPSNCSTQKLSAEVKTKFPGLYPSQKLYDHEWEKHGTCSGLPPEQYLALSKQVKEAVIIPAAYRAPSQPIRVTADQLKADFAAANPGLTESALAVNCSGGGRFLQELYVCFTTGGQPTACSQEVHQQAVKSCRNPDLLVRNVR